MSVIGFSRGRRETTVDIVGLGKRDKDATPRSANGIKQGTSRNKISNSNQGYLCRTKTKISAWIFYIMYRILTHAAGRTCFFLLFWCFSAALFRFIEGGHSPLVRDKRPDPRKDIVEIIYNVTQKHGSNDTLLQQELRVELDGYEGRLRHALMYGVASDEDNIWDWAGSFVYVGSVFTTIGVYLSFHDVVIKWKHFPRYKGQWRGALMFPLIGAWTNSWVKHRDAGDLRRHRAHYDVTVMYFLVSRHMILILISMATILLTTFSFYWYF